ncbi:hypothetical protein CA235_09555 [Sphingomonas sp. ABOLF]|uniref:hypothetical protein n=1 Tax=Sphingomonas sp. ABOLF TaxID=1985879 RepID=UPI000F7F6C03|nr:hypothetical protein [Sphingomonas sp. ABOLF]RSV15172.1 hypothetical protein CA235_09555 [Sphingomonas sp. ABOLF]
MSRRAPLSRAAERIANFAAVTHGLGLCLALIGLPVGAVIAVAIGSLATLTLVRHTFRLENRNAASR